MNLKAIDLYLNERIKGKTPNIAVEDADMADYLEDVKHKDETKFFHYLGSLPIKLRAETIMEMPIVFQIDFIEQSKPEVLAQILESLESDDATDFFQAIKKLDSADIENQVFAHLSDKKQEEIDSLIKYSEDEAGSLMQTELLKATRTESIETVLERLSALKKRKSIQTHYLYVTDAHDRLLKAIPMDDLILQNKDATLETILDHFAIAHACTAYDSVEKVLQYIEKYDITELPIVDRMGHLIGRITHDDIIDIMRKHATSQMYGMSLINPSEEIQEDLSTTSKTRALWLILNLVNAIVASIVISFFEDTIDAVVALAVLMPIVANMAGTASVQTMTVMVRQMALGEITYGAAKPTIIKELSISVINGLLFGWLAFIVSQIWFDNYLISTAMGLSMLVSFICAVALGALVPIGLKKMGFDPAIASSVIVITAVDIIGFFSFLWFATLILF